MVSCYPTQHYILHTLTTLHKNQTGMYDLQFILSLASLLALHCLLLTSVPSTELFPSTALNHGSDDLERSLGSRQRSSLALVIIAGRDLDDIRTNDVQLLDSAQDPDQLAGRPATGLGRASARCRAGVQNIDVQRQIHWLFGVQADPICKSVDNPHWAQLVDIIRVHAHEPLLRSRVGIVTVIDSGETGTQTRVRRGRVVD